MMAIEEIREFGGREKEGYRAIPFLNYNASS